MFASYIPTRREAAVEPVDPAAVARIDEDLDYTIARRVGSPAGWRAFLADHGSGAHADSARAEFDRLLAEEPNAPLDARSLRWSDSGRGRAFGAWRPVRPMKSASATKSASRGCGAAPRKKRRRA